jgi:hypothetical protein
MTIRSFLLGKRIKIFILCFAGIVESIYGKAEFLPRVDLSADLGYFFFHKSKAFNTRFMFEEEWAAYLTLFSAGDNFSFHFDPKVITGQGRSLRGLIFHPEDVSFGLITYGEYRTKFFNCFFGLDHSCFHEVDTKTRETVYWNKLISGVRSSNIRTGDLIRTFLDSSQNSLLDRISWNFTWSWYVREFFGLIDEGKIMTPNLTNYHDFTLQVKAIVFHYRTIILSVKGVTLLGVGDKSDFYCRQMVGFDTDFKGRNFISTIYAEYNMDKNWFDSRDKLLEFGVRFEK